MNIENNAGQLSPVKDTVTITESMFGGIFKSVLSEKCQINEFKINKAELITDESNHIHVTGVCDFLNCKNLPVEASFVPGEQDKVVGRIKIQLVGDTRKANSWSFSRSFKDLPKVTDFGTEITEELLTGKSKESTKSSFLDSLHLYNSYFIISTDDITDSELSVSLVKGLNFLRFLL